MTFNLFTAYENWIPNKRIIRTKEGLQELVDRLSNSKLFSCDVETPEIGSEEMYILGIGFAEGSDSWYIPVNHTSTFEQLPMKAVVKALKPVFSDQKIAKVFHNAKFDVNMLSIYDVEVKGLILDTIFMVWLCQEEHQDKDLKNSARRDLGMVLKKYKDVNGGDLENASIREVAHYCRMDCKATLGLYNFYKPVIQEEELSVVFKNEMDLLPVTMAMEKEGMLIDREKLEALGKQLNEHIQELTPQIHKLLGKRINIKSTQQLAEILYDELGLVCERTTKKGNRSTDIEALRDMQGQHEVIDLLIEYRKYNTWYSTFVKGITKKIKKNGKVYANFNQAGAISGRYSSSKPNLQNIPRDETNLKIRGIFIAPPGYKIICADYSQLELRLISRFSGDPKLVYAYKNDIDVHTLTASQMFKVDFDKVDTEQRYIAKTINFASGYGTSPGTLREILRDGGKTVDMDEAKELLNMHHRVYKRWYAWGEEMIAECEKCGYAKSWLGRRRRLPDINAKEYGIKAEAGRQAVNHIVQSCIEESQSILTKNGYIPISKLDGESIFNGEIWTSNYNVYPTGEREVYRLNLSGGKHILSTLEHRFFKWNPASLKIEECYLRDLNPTKDWVVTSTQGSIDGLLKENVKGIYDGHYRASYKKLEQPKGITEDEVYLLGYLVGDGYYGTKKGKDHYGSIYIAFGNIEHPDIEKAKTYKKETERIYNLLIRLYPNLNVRIRQARNGSRTGFNTNLCFTSIILRDRLEKLELGPVSKKDKRIPSWIFTSLPKYKIAFIKGYMDADGNISKTGLVQLTTVVEELAHGMLLLLNSLGIDAGYHKYGKGKNIFFKVNIRSKDIQKYYELVGFENFSKKERLKDCIEKQKHMRNGLNTSISGFEQVFSIEKVGVYSTYDIEILEGKQAFVCEGILVHNSASGDVVKTAMIRLFNSKKFIELGCKIVSQVHDELIIICPEDNVDEVVPLVKEIMEHPLEKDLGIDLPVSIGIGNSWDEAK
ncbi:MAG: DNA polymerase [Phycisphaerae bacterium]|jgi:DNA polymerase I-like protein with 3'-5' exonuclease and polymerase domains